MAILFAAAKNTNGVSVFPVIALGVALIVALIIALRVYRDLKGEAEESLTEPDDLFESLIAAYAAGQMSQDEYFRARDAVGRAGAGAGHSGPSSTLPVTPKAEPTAAPLQPLDPETSSEPAPPAGPVASDPE